MAPKPEQPRASHQKRMAILSCQITEDDWELPAIKRVRRAKAKAKAKAQAIADRDVIPAIEGTDPAIDPPDILDV